MAARLRSALSPFEKSQKPPKGTLASGLFEAILSRSLYLLWRERLNDISELIAVDDCGEIEVLYGRYLKRRPQLTTASSL